MLLMLLLLYSSACTVTVIYVVVVLLNAHTENPIEVLCSRLFVVVSIYQNRK